MLEQFGLLSVIIVYYLSPLIVAYILIKLFRYLAPHNSISKDFICGLIFLQATREIFRSLRRGRRG